MTYWSLWVQLTVFLQMIADDSLLYMTIRPQADTEILQKDLKKLKHPSGRRNALWNLTLINAVFYGSLVSRTR